MSEENIAAGRCRLDLVDSLRGLMIALMALDHVREYFHETALLFQPTDLDQTTAALFAARWVTHLCAPTFVFLSGVSIWLQREGGKQGWPLSRFLLVRGAWLIALELTVVAFALDLRLPFILLQVIWAIGAGMIVMAGLVHLPRWVSIAVGSLLLLVSPLGAIPFPPEWGAVSTVWTILMNPGLLPGSVGFVAYPLLPWLAFMALGYGLAPLFTVAPERRNRVLLVAGLGLLTAFAILRAINLYGDPAPWAPRADAVGTVLSFLNVTKYPPSLLFGLATLGVSLTVAPVLAKLGGPADRMLLAFGRTPLFTYVLHLYLIHAAALLVGLATGVPASAFVGFLSDNAALISHGWGLNLAWVLTIWIVLLLAMWPLSSRYAAFRSSRRHRWTSFL